MVKTIWEPITQLEEYLTSRVKLTGKNECSESGCRGQRSRGEKKTTIFVINLKKKSDVIILVYYCKFVPNYESAVSQISWSRGTSFTFLITADFFLLFPDHQNI